MLLRAACAAVFWLLAASAAEASPGPGRPGGPYCDPHTATIRKLLSHPKSFGGPIKTPRPHVGPTLLTEFGAQFQRSIRRAAADDVAAIQNDAPAARIDVGDAQIPELRPLCVLSGSGDQIACSRTLSPRSPRGPPPIA